jgi:hypothetical protein
MKNARQLMGMAMLGGILMAAVAIAQQHENHPGGPPPAGTTPAAGCCANMGNPPKPGEQPMAGHNMDMSSCPHMQAGKLADELLTSFAALEKENDMAALKLKLAAHGTLLKQLKATSEQKCPMMENMGGGMGGGMMGGMGGMQHDTPAK